MKNISLVRLTNIHNTIQQAYCVFDVCELWWYGWYVAIKSTQHDGVWFSLAPLDGDGHYNTRDIRTFKSERDWPEDACINITDDHPDALLIELRGHDYSEALMLWEHSDNAVYLLGADEAGEDMDASNPLHEWDFNTGETL
ncbi:hypothetical protein [Endozoicomonas atrinae]|uniref:hypothetical protein n=1 Tax=Endozoicomonas atrinae TaxID=1333660 RepID=UPI000824D7F8|nr:hypothetical protein [Endozoicomonas atrinae]